MIIYKENQSTKDTKALNKLNISKPIKNQLQGRENIQP